MTVIPVRQQQPYGVLVVLLLVLCCARGSQLGAPTSEAADLDVYRAVVDSMFVPHSGSRIIRLVVQDSTTVWRRDELVRGSIERLFRMPGVDSTAVRDFEARNRNAHSLNTLKQLDLAIPIDLVNSETLKALPRTDAEKYWNEFYRRYPRSSGLIAFSAIGYSADGSIAVLMVDRGCGGLCGGGYIVSVRRSAGRWRIANIQGTWVA
jgi:hypothetical protein